MGSGDDCDECNGAASVRVSLAVCVSASASITASASTNISPVDSNNTNGHTRGHHTDSAASKRAGSIRRNEDIA